LFSRSKSTDASWTESSTRKYQRASPSTSTLPSSSSFQHSLSEREKKRQKETKKNKTSADVGVVSRRTGSTDGRTHQKEEDSLGKKKVFNILHSCRNADVLTTPFGGLEAG
jgi:hypothetical protein